MQQLAYGPVARCGVFGGPIDAASRSPVAPAFRFAPAAATMPMPLPAPMAPTVPVRPPPGLSLPFEDCSLLAPSAVLPPPGLAVPCGVAPPPGLTRPGAWSSPPAAPMAQRRLRKAASGGVDDCSSSFCSTADGDVPTPRSDTPKAWSSSGSTHDPAEAALGSAGVSPLSVLVPPPPSSNEVLLDLCGLFSKLVVGTAQCPSAGSVGHHAGLCKPCDFVHRGCCTNGVQCKFCHLCGPEENKLRKKQRKAAARSVKRRSSTDDSGSPTVLDMSEVLLESS